MNIHGIDAYHAYSMKTKLSKKQAASKGLSSGKRREDTYEPSATDDREKLLASIKKKIKTGYYDSEEVVEDLSESFAKIFNTTLWSVLSPPTIKKHPHIPAVFLKKFLLSRFASEDRIVFYIYAQSLTIRLYEYRYLVYQQEPLVASIVCWCFRCTRPSPF